jgi:hypothetical protein
VLSSPSGVLSLTEQCARAQPALLIPLSELGSVEFARAAGTSSTFDLVLHARDGAAHEARMHRLSQKRGQCFPGTLQARAELLFCAAHALTVRGATHLALHVVRQSGSSARGGCRQRFLAAIHGDNAMVMPCQDCTGVVETPLTQVSMACAHEQWRLVALGGTSLLGAATPCQLQAAARSSQASRARSSRAWRRM